MDCVRGITAAASLKREEYGYDPGRGTVCPPHHRRGFVEATAILKWHLRGSRDVRGFTAVALLKHANQVTGRLGEGVSAASPLRLR